MPHDTTRSVRQRTPDRAKIKINGAWTAVPNRLLRDRRLSRDARLLGCMMFLHAGNSGRAFPSQEQLASEMGQVIAEEDGTTTERCVTVRSIQRWLSELRHAGWLAWRQTLRNNEYDLLDPAEASDDAETSGEEDGASYDDTSEEAHHNALTGATQESCGATQGSHADATERSGSTTAASPSNTTAGSAPMIALSCETTPMSPSTMIESDSLKIDSCHEESSSESMRTHHPDDDDDEVVRYLQGLGITTAQEFRALDLAAVQERVERLQRDPNCWPGAIVQRLRASPPRRTPVMGSQVYMDELRARYGNLFRAGSDVSDVVADDAMEHAGPRMNCEEQ